jgi:hypothetical protein
VGRASVTKRKRLKVCARNGCERVLSAVRQGNPRALFCHERCRTREKASRWAARHPAYVNFRARRYRRRVSRSAFWKPLTVKRNRSKLQRLLDRAARWEALEKEHHGRTH